jgi:5-hydroxyisourate hydrolase-like protein (transthyretin family)
MKDRRIAVSCSRAVPASALALLAIVGCLSSAHAQDQDRGKPVENASIIFHTFHDGKDQGNMEVKTNEEGKASIDVIPIGDEVQLQVFRSGFQTYGENFTNDLATRDITVKVKPPGGQYSVYQNKPLDSNATQSVTPQPTQSAVGEPERLAEAG